MRTSAIPGFYKKTLVERVEIVKDFAGLSDEEAKALLSMHALTLETADRMIENVIGSIQLPMGIATNFLINGKDYLIPMAIEEPSVVAAASKAAKIARKRGGFRAQATKSVMRGQIQVLKVPDPYAAGQRVLSLKDKLIEVANSTNPTLVKLGGGAFDIGYRVLEGTKRGDMLIVEIFVDCRDAMGANTVNTMAETIAPIIEDITGGRVRLRILSNLATERIARAWAIFDKEELGGEDVVDGILDAYAFAEADVYRCTTHNKGIMNGITAVVLATGNDTRAIEAGAHAYAARNGRYSSLTKYEKDKDGNLVGSIEVPLAVGIVGGATRVNPIAKIALKILGVSTAQELAKVMASVGLAQNLAALRALATEGIQRGHMKLHARNLAVMAGARPEEMDLVVEELVKSGQVTYDKAIEIVKKLRGG
jgi:hydroxymethylglutaryl-CoA reductase